MKSAVWSRAPLESSTAAPGLCLGALPAALMSGVPENGSVERPNQIA